MFCQACGTLHSCHKMLTVLLPVMYLRSVDICVEGQQTHTGKLYLSYNQLTTCFGRCWDHLQDQNPMDSLHTRGHVSVFMYVYRCFK